MRALLRAWGGSAGRIARSWSAGTCLAAALLAAAPAAGALAEGEYCLTGLGPTTGPLADGWLAVLAPGPPPTVTDLTPLLATALVNPRDCAVDPTTGDIIVVDEGGGGGGTNALVHRIDYDAGGGTLFQTILATGAPFVNPRGVAVGPDGTVYVADVGPGTTTNDNDGGIFSITFDALGTPTVNDLVTGASFRVDSPVDLDLDPRPFGADVNVVYLELSGRLRRVPAGGGTAQNLPGGNAPGSAWSGLEVGPYGNYFLTGGGGQAAVRYDRLTGTRTTIASGGGGSPRHVSVDYTTADLAVADAAIGVLRVPPNAYLAGAPAPSVRVANAALPHASLEGIGYAPRAASADPGASFGMPTRRAPIPGGSFTVMGPGAALSNGDVENRVDLFIEVTQPAPELRIHLFDANARDGFDYDFGGGYDTELSYRLRAPDGSIVSAVTVAANDRVDLDQRIATLGVNALAVGGPGIALAPDARGLYRLEIVSTTGGDVNAVGVWVEDFHAYSFAPVFGPLNTFGGPPTLANLDPLRLYPYAPHGCELTSIDYDWDEGVNPGTAATLTTRLGRSLPVPVSGQTVHGQTQIDLVPAPGPPETGEADYGIQTFEGTLSPDTDENNVASMRMADFRGWDDAGGSGTPVPVPPGTVPIANPTLPLQTSPSPAVPLPGSPPGANTFLRYYLPRYDEAPGAAAAPYAPYAIHWASPLSEDPGAGGSPTAGQPSRFLVRVRVVNPDPVNALLDVDVRAPVPDPTVYVDAGPNTAPAGATGGGTVTVSCDPLSAPAPPCFGEVRARWPAIAAGGSETLAYFVEVTPQSAGEQLYLSGGPAVRGGGAAPAANGAPTPGTTVQFTPAWTSPADGRVESLGPLCDLSVEEGTVTPIAVDLAELRAEPGDGEVRLVWRTAAEWNNLGFHVYRRLAGEADFTRITPSLILGRGTTDLSARYALLDRGVPNGTQADYLLEDVEITGRTTLHGPVSATPQAGAALAPLDPAVQAVTLDPGTGGGAGAGGATSEPSEGGLPGAAGGALGGAAGAAAAESFEVLESDARHVLVEVRVPEVSLGATTLDGVEYTTVAAPGWGRTLQPGHPELPARTFWIEAADTARARVAVVEREGATRALPGPVAPVASSAPAGGSARPVHAPDPAAYASPSPYPARAAELAGSAATGRGTRLLALRVQPARYRAADGALDVDARLRVRIDLGGPEALPALAPESARAADRRAVAASPGVKVASRGEGLVRVDRDALVAAGLDPAADPRRFHVFRDGAEIAVLVEGEADGSFDAGDALVYWAAGHDTRYADEEVVFVVVGDTPGLRAAARGAAPAAPAPARSAAALARFEEQRVYLPGVLNGEGDNFVGRFVFDAPVASRVATPAATGGAATLRVRLRGGTRFPDVDPDHHFGVSVGGADVLDARFDGTALFDATAPLPTGSVRDGETVVEVAPRFDSGAAFDLVYVDALEIAYRRWLELVPADGGRLLFTAEVGGAHRVGGLSPSQAARVFDVSDPAAPAELLGVRQAGALEFEAEAGARYAVVREDAYAAPSRVAANAPSDWLDGAHGADWLAIAHASLVDAAGTLAEHREAQGLRTAVVDVEDVFDELAGGVRTPVAIRDFVRAISASWSPAPRHLVLIGDASYDYRDFLGGSAPDLVPTMLVDTAHVEAASDAYFGTLADGAAPDLFVGRLPVRTPAELDAVVAKLIAYEQAAAGSAAQAQAWREHLVLVADDGLGDGNPAEAGAFEAILDGVDAHRPPDFAATRIALSELPDAEAGSEANRRLRRALEDGAGLAVYAGHGGARVWADERIFDAGELLAIPNGGRLPVYVVLNCLNGFFDAPNEESLAEEALRAPDRGAVAFISSTTVSALPGQAAFAEALAERILRAGVRDLGRAFTEAKQAIAGDPGAEDVLRAWVLIGDPATHLGVATAPVADAGPDRTGSARWWVRLDGSRSASPEGRPLSYAWRVVSAPAGAAARLVVDGDETARPWFGADLPGEYRIELVVSDGQRRSAPAHTRVTMAARRTFGCAGDGAPAGPVATTSADLLVLLLLPAMARALVRTTARRR